MPVNLKRRLFFSDVFSLLKHIDNQELRDYRHAKVISVSGGASLYNPEYKYCEKTITSLLKTFWTNRATLIQMGNLWISNFFNNIQSLPGSVTSFPVRHGTTY